MKEARNCLEQHATFLLCYGPLLDSAVLRYEIKFSIDEIQAQQVRDWAAAHLTPDSHATDSEGTYRIKTLYLDNAAQDVYWRRRNYKHHKFRLRRYGNEPLVFLERKSRWLHQVEKYRTVIPESDLPLLASGNDSSAWEGSWFHQEILSGGLKALYQVAYERTAYIGTQHRASMRLTLDRQISSSVPQGWRFVDSGSLPLFAEGVILELKYCDLLPSPFQNLIQLFGLKLKRISKYRLAVRASGQISHQGRLWLSDVNRSTFTESPDEVQTR